MVSIPTQGEFTFVSHPPCIRSPVKTTTIPYCTCFIHNSSFSMNSVVKRRHLITHSELVGQSPQVQDYKHQKDGRVYASTRSRSDFRFLDKKDLYGSGPITLYALIRFFLHAKLVGIAFTLRFLFCVSFKAEENMATSKRECHQEVLVVRNAIQQDFCLRAMTFKELHSKMSKKSKIIL